jgi:hypothetical protein
VEKEKELEKEQREREREREMEQRKRKAEIAQKKYRERGKGEVKQLVDGDLEIAMERSSIQGNEWRAQTFQLLPPPDYTARLLWFTTEHNWHHKLRMLACKKSEQSSKEQMGTKPSFSHRNLESQHDRPCVLFTFI